MTHIEYIIEYYFRMTHRDVTLIVAGKSDSFLRIGSFEQNFKDSVIL